MRQIAPSGPGPPGEPPAALETTGLHEALVTFRRQRWLIILTTVVGTALAALVGASRMPVFTATAEVIIAPQRSGLVDPEASGSSLDYKPREIETQIGVVRSQAFLDNVVAGLLLREDAAFGAEVAKPELSFAGQVENALRTLGHYVPETWMIDRGLAVEDMPQVLETALRPFRSAWPDDDPWADPAISRISEHLRVWQAAESFTVYFSFEATDPGLAARIATEAAERFVRELRDVKLNAVRQGAEWLAGQVERLSEELLQAEEAVERFRNENRLNAEGDDRGELQVSDINLSLIATRSDIADKEATLDQLRAMRQREDVDAVTQLVTSPDLLELRRRRAELAREEADLRTEFGPNHPRLLAHNAEEAQLRQHLLDAVDWIINGLEADLRILRAREQAIDDRLSKVEQQVADNRNKSVELRDLQRNAAASRSQYLTMLERYRQMREQNDIVGSDARLVAPAPVPTTPSNGGVLHFAVAGFTASFLAGSLMAFLRERVDRTLRTPAQVAQVLGGLPTLGVVPQKGGPWGPQRCLLELPQSDYLEAINNVSLRLTLLEVDRAAAPRVVLITSAVPDEGKTTLAASLAILAAGWSRRVILLDLDLRRPQVHRLFGEERTTGIVEVLAEDKSLQDGIHRHAASGVDYLPVRRRPVNPVALLASRTMRSALVSLRKTYDLIVIDTPPLLAATDATVICGMVDQVVLAVRWGRTDRAAVAGALDRLHQAQANVAGVVLTRTNMRKYNRFDYYGYGQYAKKYVEYHSG